MSDFASYLPPLDIDRIRNGDWLATAEAMQKLYDAVNNEIRVRSQIVAPWKDVTYVAANFLQGSIATPWTVNEADVIDLKYLKFGTLCVLQFQIESAGVASLTQDLVGIRIPELRAKATRQGATDTGSSCGCIVWDDDNPKPGWAYVRPVWDAVDEPSAVLHIELAKNAGVSGSLNFQANTRLNVYGVVTFEVEG
jgi:hypothetical protein